MAQRKKLSLSQLVLDFVLLYLFPLGSCEYRQWLGWVESFRIILVFLRQCLVYKSKRSQVAVQACQNDRGSPRNCRFWWQRIKPGQEGREFNHVIPVKALLRYLSFPRSEALEEKLHRSDCAIRLI
ncbi:hypothetical protein AOLI_G00016110 [Acnodon oligacanthus]